jgi:hypothetical protein
MANIGYLLTQSVKQTGFAATAITHDRHYVFGFQIEIYPRIQRSIIYDWRKVSEIWHGSRSMPRRAC